VTTISIFLFLSGCLNILLIWYARRLAKQFLSFTENLGVLEESLGAFSEHLRAVHELEMFYGDDTLGRLIKHSRKIVEEVKEFYDAFSLEDNQEDEDDDSP
tara:strand:- start:1338 stop:1640 length:303 start_codon:yes stop_codon:yes gene_type:complete